MYQNIGTGAGAGLALTGLATANYVLAGVVLIALGSSILALLPRNKNREWK